MDKFLQGCAAVLIGVILILLIGKDRKDLGLLISVGISCMVALTALQYLKPVLDFIHRLESVGNLESTGIRILLKVIGIGILSEIAALICSDAGNSSLGKSLQYLSAAVMLWLSLPLFTMLMELLQRILGEL